MVSVSSTPHEISQATSFKERHTPVSFDDFAGNFTRVGDTFTDANGFEIKAAYETYPDAAALEWTLWLTNRGTQNSRRVKNLLPLDCTLEAGEHCSISYCLGAHSGIDDFMFREQTITDTLRLSSVGSRSITPFFNLDLGGHGVCIAIGWTQGWFLEISKQDGKITLKAGMPETDFYLKPGECVRSPRILLLFWEGDKARSYNLLRRHLVAHHIPKDANGEPYPPVCLNTWGSMKTHNHLKLIDYVKEHDLKYDAYWIDAGWYGEDHDDYEFQKLWDGLWFIYQGDWRVNRTIHPNTLKPISDAAHACGMKLLLWYDMLNAVVGRGWTVDHPEWGKVIETQGESISLLNINHPDAHAWLIRTLLASMEENGVDYYREDPPPIYGGEDEEGRIGICEMKAVEALYAFWDALRQKHPEILIDNCGGGATRVDLETVSRSYVLWRSDYNCSPAADPIGSQVGNIGLGHFVPLVSCAPPTKPGHDYTFRSGLYGGIGFGLFHVCAFENGPTYPADDYPIEWHRAKLEEYQAVKRYFSGDFYVLQDGELSDAAWCSYQMSRPDLGEGVILAFRRQNAPQDSIVVRPVLEDGVYTLTDRDTGSVLTYDTAHDSTLTLFADEPLSSVMLMIKKIG